MPNKTLTAYVDGFNLYNGIHASFGHRYLWLDLVALVQRMRPNHEVVKVKYFTARLLDDPEALSRQDVYLAALEAMHPERIEVVHGRYQRKPLKCDSCGDEWVSYEEKETDVNLALTIARDALANPTSDYFLISGDSDASPAIREAMNVNPTGFYAAFFPPSRQSEELRQLMPRSIVIGRDKLLKSQLPETVTDRAGSSFERPSKWTPDYWSREEEAPPTLRAKPSGAMPTPMDMPRHRHGE